MSQYEHNKKCHLHNSKQYAPLCGSKGVAGVYSVESMKSGSLKKENVCQRCLAKAQKFRLIKGEWAQKYLVRRVMEFEQEVEADNKEDAMEQWEDSKSSVRLIKHVAIPIRDSNKVRKAKNLKPKAGKVR